MQEAAVREAVATARLPTAQPLPPFAGGAGAGAGAGAGTTALRGILHCRNPPPGCGPDVASNGHSQSPLVAAAAAVSLAGASDKKKSRRRSSKSEGGESTLVGYET